MHDYHVHSNYSDGGFLWAMANAAAEAGLDGVGFADHCTVTDRPFHHRFRCTQGFNLDVTYDRRREGLANLRENFDIAIHDAVEMDYAPGDEAAIESFLGEAGFDYAIGSVHFVGERNVMFAAHFEDDDEDERHAAVDRYYDALVSLVESELFAVAAHPDLVERNPVLAGLSTREQYERVARAFADSRTVPEINAGRVRELGEPHPSETFFEVLREEGISFTVGSDAHAKEEVGDRAEFLYEFVDEHGLSLVDPVTLASPW